MLTRFSSTLIAALVLSTVANAQETAPARVSLHGYLTQGYGMSTGGRAMGLTNEGTADYRRAALLARYEATEKDHFVLQLAHRRLGDSPSMQFEDNVKVDMAFYERHFETGTKLRVGKVLMPFGIYNDIRYAGTLLPFYRAPMTVYFEGTYTNETIDGVTLGQTFGVGRGWELSAEAFGGSYQLLEMGTVMTSPTTAAYTAAQLQAKSALGAQLWLATPLEGLRFGVNGRRHTDVGGIYERGTGAATTEWNASVDATFARWQLRTEGLQSTSLGARLRSAYVQAGFRPTERLALNVQSERSDINSTSPLGSYSFKFARDNAAGVSFSFNANTVLKAEAHRTRGFLLEEIVDFTGSPRKGAYYLTSLSVSF